MNAAEPSRVLIAMRWLFVLLPFGLLAGPAVGDIVASLMAVVFLGHCAFTRQWQWVRAPWVIALLLLWLHFMLIALWATDGADAFKRGLVWVRYPVFMAALVFWIARDAWTQRRFLQTLLAVVLFLVFDTLLQFYRGLDLFGRPYQTIESFIRLTGPYSTLRPGIMLVYIGFPALFFLFEKVQAAVSYRRAMQAGFVVSVVAFILAVYLSGERMALLLTILGFTLAPLLVKRYRMIWIGGGVASIVLLGALISIQPTLLVRQYGYFKKEIMNLDESVYVQIWKSAAVIGADHPIGGVGLKNYRIVCPDEQYGPIEPTRCASHPHNMYLELFAESGTVGVLLFMTAIGLWLHACWQRRGVIAGDMVLIGLFITLVIRIWPLASISSQFNPWAGLPLWLFTGLLLARMNLLRGRDTSASLPQ